MKPTRDVWLIAVVCVAALATGLLYADYWPERATRWGRLDNDRNAHYLTALKLGNDLRSFRMGEAIHDLRRIRTWPPLHAVSKPPSDFTRVTDRSYGGSGQCRIVLDRLGRAPLGSSFSSALDRPKRRPDCETTPWFVEVGTRTRTRATADPR